ALGSSVLHNRTVDFLVKGRAAGRKLPQRMVFLPHQKGAEGQGLADLALVQLTALQRLASELPMGQRPASQTEEADAALGEVPGGGIDAILLQPTVACPHHGEIGESSLELPGDPEMP